MSIKNSYLKFIEKEDEGYFDEISAMDWFDEDDTHLSPAKLKEVSGDFSHSHLLLDGESRDYFNFSKKSLNFSTILHSKLRFTHFFRTEMISSLIVETDFFSSKMEFANLDFSEISGCSFYGSNLNSISFQSAVIRDVDFSWCDLRGADFFGAQIENCKFRGIIFDESTTFPFSLDELNNNIDDDNQEPMDKAS